LASLGTVFNSRDLEGYTELIQKRKMQKIMKQWSKDNKNYVFPNYSSPVLLWWRWDILQEFGWKKVPETYSEIYKLCEQVTIPNRRYAMSIVGFPAWWGRWSDFIAFYYAASGGKPYISNGKAVFNNKYGKEVATFFKTLFDKKYAKWDPTDKQAFYEGKIIGEYKTPQDIDTAKRTYPEILKKIKVGPVIVPDSYKGQKYTFDSTKGLVIFKQSKNSDEAWKFVKWVFSHDKFSILWLRKTGLPPARGDLMTNPVFKELYKEDIFSYDYAKYVNSAIPSASIAKTINVQEIMTNYLLEPIIFNTESVENALNITVERIDNTLADKY
jgi:multiple sugar transport system substrate-binding protein